MRSHFGLAVFLLAVVGGLGLFAALQPPKAIVQHEPGPIAKPRVKLAVLIVFDQMRGDYPEKWQPLFGPDGFVRLQTDGATFTRCYYPYGTTSTGPGHASMLTGTCPDRHGIVNNNWFERGETVYCAGSTRYDSVPPPVKQPDPKARRKEIGSPDRLLSETVADVLKRAHPTSKVFGLSLKDRSAILPTGKRPDGAYWFDGRFVTSTYYTDQVHPWVERFNSSRAADKWFGKEWNHFRPNVDYVKWSGPDQMAGESKGSQVTTKDDPARGWAQGVVFPHPNTGGRDKPGKEYYESLANSPYGNELLWELARSCIEAEQLGADDVPDLLVVSFASNDLIGHTWGPDSQEVLDVTLRSDALMAEILHYLDEKVGPGQYLVGVTADHGICPLVEVSRGLGRDARRVDPKDIQKAVNEHLTTVLGNPGVPAGTAKKPAWIDAFAAPWIHLNPKLVTVSGKSPAEVAQLAAEFLAKHPDIARVFTRADLQGTFPASDVIANRCQRAYHPDRCGDLIVVLKEWCLPSAALGTGTTHGSPYDYDAHVPLILYGPGIAGGASEEPTTPQALAAIFSEWLGLPRPNHAEYPVPVALEPK